MDSCCLSGEGSAIEPGRLLQGESREHVLQLRWRPQTKGALRGIQVSVWMNKTLLFIISEKLNRRILNAAFAVTPFLGRYYAVFQARTPFWKLRRVPWMQFYCGQYSRFEARFSRFQCCNPFCVYERFINSNLIADAQFETPCAAV